LLRSLREAVWAHAFGKAAPIQIAGRARNLLAAPPSRGKSCGLVWRIFLQVLLPILALIGLGWVLDRKWRLDLATMVRLNIYLFVPGVIFYEVVGSELTAGEALKVMAFTVCIIAGMFIASWVAGRLSAYPPPQTRALQMATMFYNSGNYGVPLMTLAYPALGPVLQVFVVLTQNISCFTVGLLLASSHRHQGPVWRIFLPVLRQVSIWAVISAVLVRVTHLPVQEWRWLWEPMKYLHSALVGVALVTLGVQLSQSEVRQSFSRIGWALGLRLAGGPLLALALVPLFGFTGETARVMILSSGFPTAVNTALLAHEFESDSAFAAAAVFYSTLASMVTVTFLIAMLQYW
jgi:predicted permease